MNRGAIRGELQSRLRLPAQGDPLLTDDVLNGCVRLALNDISAAHDWPWLLTSGTVTFSTSTGKAAYPADCVRIRELIVNNRRALRCGLAEWIDAQTLGSYVWTEIGGQLALTPIPTVAPTATLYYCRQEPVLTADTASPLLPEANVASLIARASYHANMRRRVSEDAAADDNEYQAGVKQMRTAMWAKTGPRQVRTGGRLDTQAVW